MIEISLIRTDGETQSRSKLSDETVAEYKEAYENGATFPPVILFFDGSDRWLADGFHRVWAAKAAGKTLIHENIIPGTRRDAILYSLKANSQHGLKRTNADKRCSVQKMLDDEEWNEWSDRKIADACGVSTPFVSAIRRPTVAQKQKENREAIPTKNPEKCNPITPLSEVGLIPEEKQEDKQIENEPPDEDAYTPLDAAHDQIEELQTALSVACMGEASDEEKEAAKGLIDGLRAEVKTLTVSLKAAYQSRDSLMQENAQLKRQCQMQRKEIEKLKSGK